MEAENVMEYDINETKFSGRILDLKEIQTKTGTPMASIRIQCHKEQIRAVAFKKNAETILQNFEVGGRIEFSGRLQSSHWEKNGTRYLGFQINISEVEGHRIPEKPRAGLEDVDYVGGPF